MNNKNKLIIIVVIAVFVKLCLFMFINAHAPDGKIEIDSKEYITTGLSLAETGIFKKSSDSSYEIFRTPGYPLFIGIFHGILRLSLNGVIFVQILITFLIAYLVYLSANKIDPRIRFLSTVIILFDPAITVFSMMIMTETLFMLLLSIFILTFISYIKTHKTMFLLLSGIILAVAAYVRPAGYYLGVAMTPFVIYVIVKERFNTKNVIKGITHCLIFFFTVYSLIGLWHYRNYKRIGRPIFSSITNATIDAEGILKSYERNKDPISKGLPPIPYYLNVTSRCLMSLMMRPTSFKYFDFRPLTIAGKVFSYPWIIFWISGLLVGLAKMKSNIYYHFLTLIILYFICATIVGTMWGSGSRFRLPMLPFIAILSAYGWACITTKVKALKEK